MPYLTGSTKAETFLRRFFAETTKIDREETFEFTKNGEFHVMPYGVVVDAILNTGDAEQSQIADTIRKIDFANGDVCHFLRHLGQALAA